MKHSAQRGSSTCPDIQPSAHEVSCERCTQARAPRGIRIASVRSCVLAPWPSRVQAFSRPSQGIPCWRLSIIFVCDSGRHPCVSFAFWARCHVSGMLIPRVCMGFWRMVHGSSWTHERSVWRPDSDLSVFFPLTPIHLVFQGPDAPWWHLGSNTWYVHLREAVLAATYSHTPCACDTCKGDATNAVLCLSRRRTLHTSSCISWGAQRNKPRRS
jgi:hypothetical protein